MKKESAAPPTARSGARSSRPPLAVSTIQMLMNAPSWSAATISPTLQQMSGDKRECPFITGAGGTKRSNCGQGSATAQVKPDRLIDDEFAFLLIEDVFAASRAKTKGWIKSRVLAQKEYAEVRRDCLLVLPAHRAYPARCTTSDRSKRVSERCLIKARMFNPAQLSHHLPLLTTNVAGVDGGAADRAHTRPRGPARALPRNDCRHAPCSGHTRRRDAASAPCSVQSAHVSEPLPRPELKGSS